jgi:hypothetical protein
MCSSHAPSQHPSSFLFSPYNVLYIIDSLLGAIRYSSGLAASITSNHHHHSKRTTLHLKKKQILMMMMKRSDIVST